MRDFYDRLTVLDQGATTSLTVITFFDKLVASQVSAAGLLRGAAQLAGVPVGCAAPGIRLRVQPDGTEAAPCDPPAGYPTLAMETGAVVWLERQGPAHPTDGLVLERLALALAASTAVDDRHRQRVTALLLSPPEMPSPDDPTRIVACAALQLNPRTPVRAIAQPLSVPAPLDLPHAELTTPWGKIRGAISPTDRTWTGRTGIGVPAPPLALFESWRTAIIALRLHDGGPAGASADDYGPLLDLAYLTDMRPEPPDDATRIDRSVDGSWSISELHSLAAGGSLRDIAASAGLHHSTIQSRLPKLTRILGYDPRTPLGRTRLHVALLLHRLAHTRID